MLLLSKTNQKDLANLQKIADRDDELIEMRDKHGLLLAVATSINALTELKNKEGKPTGKSFITHLIRSYFPLGKCQRVID